MTGRRSIVGLSLFCAFLFSAFVAQGASAATFEPSTNTTAFTCVEDPGDGTSKTPTAIMQSEPEGYSHELIPLNETTAITITGTSTSTLHATPAGLNITITSTASSGTGWIKNTEPSEGVHRMIGHVNVEYTGLKAESSIKKCTVKSPIVVEADLESVEDTSSGTMGVKFSRSRRSGALHRNHARRLRPRRQLPGDRERDRHRRWRMRRLGRDIGVRSVRRGTDLLRRSGHLHLGSDNQNAGGNPISLTTVP